MACPGDTVLMTTFSPGKCTGDTYLRLYDPLSGTQLAENDDYYINNDRSTRNSQIIYTFASSGNVTCRPYEIREGCYATYTCGGQVYFAVNPTSAPTSAPTSLSVCASVNENSVATISCPSSTVVSTINFASYGTPTGFCGAFSKGSCDSGNSMPVVAGACLNKATCTILAQNSVFGDPCRNTLKRLYIHAVCGLPLSVCASVDENSVATISCPSSTVVKTIKFASYGTPTGSCGAFSKGSCDSGNSMPVVAGACLNKATCTIYAQNSVFGDPCGNTPKRLYIQAFCNPTL